MQLAGAAQLGRRSRLRLVATGPPDSAAHADPARSKPPRATSGVCAPPATEMLKILEVMAKSWSIYSFRYSVEVDSFQYSDLQAQTYRRKPAGFAPRLIAPSKDDKVLPGGWAVAKRIADG